jgi:hypothetical protein
VIPTIVTTAKLFTLRPAVQTLESIREAKAPHEVADELSWTWCYYAAHGTLLEHNNTEIEFWKKHNKDLRWQGLEDQLAYLWSGLHWVLVVNIHNLGNAVRSLHHTFLALPKDFSRTRQLSAIRKPKAKTRQKLPKQRTQ